MGATAALGIDPYDMGIQAGEIAKKLFADGNARGHILSHPRKRVLMKTPRRRDGGVSLGKLY